MPTDPEDRRPEILQALEELARDTAEIVTPVFDAAGAAFLLIGADRGAGGWMTYVSNSDRASMTALTEEFLERQRTQGDRLRPQVPNDSNGKPVMIPGHPGDLVGILRKALASVSDVQADYPDGPDGKGQAMLEALSRVTREALFLWLEGEITSEKEAPTDAA